MTMQLAELLRGRRVAVLTGAGASTDSGIPDYRGPVSRLKPRDPIKLHRFVGDAAARARYWARSTVGWPRFRAFRPNRVHEALARLERAGHLGACITQNVDRLHRKAGHERVIELHGSLFEARCLDCGAHEARDALQARLLALNPDAAGWTYALAPDGDVDIPDDVIGRFRVPPCAACGGLLKPDVVFFGENVPPARVRACYDEVDAAGALLVVGSSLAVFSSYRFALRARDRDLPIAIINQGDTRADPFATLRLDAPAAPTLEALERALSPGRRPG